MIQRLIEHTRFTYFKDQYPVLRLIQTVIGLVGKPPDFEQLLPSWATIKQTDDQIPARIAADIAAGIKSKKIKAIFLNTLFWRYGEDAVKEVIRGRTN